MEKNDSPSVEVFLPKLVHRAYYMSSASQARRQIKQGAIKLNGKVIKELCFIQAQREPFVISRGKQNDICFMIIGENVYYVSNIDYSGAECPYKGFPCPFNVNDIVNDKSIL